MDRKLSLPVSTLENWVCLQGPVMKWAVQNMERLTLLSGWWVEVISSTVKLLLDLLAFRASVGDGGKARRLKQKGSGAS